MIPIALATEDALSESIGQRLLAELTPRLGVPMLLRRGGFGYLKSNMSRWRKLAELHPVLILTDLDAKACPSVLLTEWLDDRACPPNLLLRVAVREAESWLLADHQAIRQLIGPRGKLPVQPDAVSDPKPVLLKLAQLAPRDVRLDLVKVADAASSQGIGYNAHLTNWVRNEWSPERAAQRSASLERTRLRLQQMVSRLVC
jgi:hypothetical protein